MRSVSRYSGLVGLFAILFAGVASAQGTTVNAVRGRVSERMVVGSTTLGDVLRIVGSSTVSSGTGTMNPAVIDSDGDVLEDTTTTVSTAGAHTWGAAGQFSTTLGVTGATTLGSSLSVTGLVTGSSGTLTIGSPTSIANNAPLLRIIDSNAGTDEKVHQFVGDSNQFALQTLTDAFGSPADVFRTFRTGNDAARWDWGGNLDLIQPAVNYSSNLGALSRKYLTLHAAELWVETLVAQDVMATIGGRILVGPTSALTADISASDTTICLKHNQGRSGDRLLFEADGKFEVMAIDSGPLATGCTTGYQYAVTRSLDPTPASIWYAGDAAFNTGVVGNGHWDIYSNRSAKGTQSYSATVAVSRPVAYWRFGDLTTTDISGSGLTLTKNGTVNTVAGAGTPISDSQGGAESVSGGYLTRADHATLDITGPLSIEAWINWQSATTGVLISKGAVGEFELIVDNSGRVDFQSGNGTITTTSITACNTGAITPGGSTWTYLVVTRDAANVRCYINGTLNKTTAAATAPSATTQNLGIFARSNGGTPLPTGTYLDEIALYNRTLTQADITAHYAIRTGAVKATQFGPTMCANVRFDFSYNGWDPRLCIGNLQGTYDYATPKFGMTVGDFAADWSAFDDTGWRLMYGTAVKMQATGGNLALTGNLDVSTSGAIRMNATGFDTGIGFYMDFNSASPRFRIGTEISDPSPNYLRWTGSALEMKSNTITIGSSGLSVSAKNNSTFSSNNGYNFLSSFSGTSPSLWAYEDSNQRRVALDNFSTQTSRSATIRLLASDYTGESAGIFLTTDGSGTPGTSNDAEMAISGVHRFSINGNDGALALTLSCSSGQAIKTLTVRFGIVTAATCGAP